MRIVMLAFLLCTAFPASAQVYRWVDETGRVTYSNEPPPPGVKATTVNIDAQPGPPSLPTATDLPRREVVVARPAVERFPPSSPPVRGLEFRKYLSIQRGMTEGELLGIAGQPDLVSRERSLRTYTYMPTPADPFTTTIFLVRGRVHEIERVRKF
jgi:hypothetical protein